MREKKVKEKLIKRIEVKVDAKGGLLPAFLERLEGIRRGETYPQCLPMTSIMKVL